MLRVLLGLATVSLAVYAAPTKTVSPPQFPGSVIAVNATWGDTLNGWANKPATQEWALCYSSFTDNHDNATAFHKQCDQHNTTMVLAINELSFTFGGYATASWGGDRVDRNASSNFIFRLHRGAPSSYDGGPVHWVADGGDTTGDPTQYQSSCPFCWPRWGNFDLDMGYGGGWAPPGDSYGYCLQGGTYGGYLGDTCGGYFWGRTDLEVWYPVGK